MHCSLSKDGVPSGRLFVSFRNIIIWYVHLHVTLSLKGVPFGVLLKYHRFKGIVHSILYDVLVVLFGNIICWFACNTRIGWCANWCAFLNLKMLYVNLVSILFHMGMWCVDFILHSNWMVCHLMCFLLYLGI